MNYPETLPTEEQIAQAMKMMEDGYKQLEALGCVFTASCHNTINPTLKVQQIISFDLLQPVGDGIYKNRKKYAMTQTNDYKPNIITS